MPRVLIVDDDLDIISVLSRVLERDGHTVFTASRAAEAIGLIDEVGADIALVDHWLGDGDGLSVLRAIWARRPGCGRVLMSGCLEVPLVLEAVNAGYVHRVLNKPISIATLRETVNATAAIRLQIEDDWRRLQAREIQQERDMLTDCLVGDFLRLALQPIYSMDGTTLMACEALLRSTHPTLSNPMLIIQAAERCGMIPDVGAVVARLASAWVPRLPGEVRLFVNLHPDELREPTQLISQLTPLLPWAERVVLEITEHSKHRPGPEWISGVQALRAEGFAIAVDDLGAGYNSLGVLASLQPDYIKVDMSIVRDVDFDPYKQRLIALLVQLADSTGSYLVAEGVETRCEADALRELHAHFVQGYLFGRPALEPDFVLPAQPLAQLRTA